MVKPVVDVCGGGWISDAYMHVIVPGATRPDALPSQCPQSDQPWMHSSSRYKAADFPLSLEESALQPAERQ